MVFYRKYRPQTIAELDLVAVREKLSSILSAKELPHAFLFTGPKGLGKTSSARILAKAINCENKKGFEPCNKCEACISITNGSNLDVIEIDAASNRGIDEIRDLREKIKFSPATLSKKVYIIDEVHMLTTDAFNALLKTLEEPPSHALFVLCTTEVEKVPATIVSRTFHVQFGKPTKEEIIHSLERVVKGEKLDVEKEVLDEVYKLSEGSFRDGAKILEELSFASPEKKITLATVETSYKSTSTASEIKKLLEALSQKDLPTSIKIVEGLSKNGADFKVVTEKLAESLHAIVLGIEENSNLNQKEAVKLLTLVNESYRDIKFSVLPQIPLELVIVGFCLEETENIKPKTEDKNEKIGESSVVPKTNPPASGPESKIEKPVFKIQHPASNAGEMFAENSKSDNFMAALLSALKQDNHSIAGILRGCRLIEIKEGKAIFETKYKFHKDKLSEAKTGSILDKRASEILAENIHVVVNLVSK